MTMYIQLLHNLSRFIGRMKIEYIWEFDTTIKNIFKRMNKFSSHSIFISIMILLFAGCTKGSSGPDVSGIDIEVKPHLFFVDLFEMNEETLDEDVKLLSKKYGTYLDAYSQQIIKIGSPEHPDYPKNLRSFLNYEDNKEVYAKCKEKFVPAEWLAEKITDAFRHYKYYFPYKDIPEVYLHTSYFNQSIAVDSGWISVSIEKYLGAECEFYEWLAIPKYLRIKMVPEKIVPDIIKAIAYSEFTIKMKNDDVLSNIIKEGKILYFVRAMRPELPDTLLFDYNSEQIEWCQNFESDIWASMIEQKHLYNNEHLVIQKYVGDSPFTYFFGQTSPGKAAVYLGYRIVSSYMENHPEVKIEDLLMQKDAHKILREARYRP